MTETVMSSGCQRLLSRLSRVWEEPESGDDLDFSVGKTTGGTCCCTHQACGTFRKKRWCKRVFTIGVVTPDDEGQSPEVSALMSAVSDMLATRSYEAFSFKVMCDMTGRRFDPIFVVLLAEGEPPLTIEEVESWEDRAVTTLGIEQGTCHVDMLRCTCCLFTAGDGLCTVLDAYCDESGDERSGLSSRSLLHRLVAEALSSVGHGESVEALMNGLGFNLQNR